MPYREHAKSANYPGRPRTTLPNGRSHSPRRSSAEQMLTFPGPWWEARAVKQNRLPVKLMAMNKPKHAGIGLAVVLLGLPVYQLVFTRLAPREAPGDASSRAESSPASAAVETT